MAAGQTPIAGSGQTNVGWLTGWNFAENAATSAAARVLLRAGGATGPVIADIRLGAAQSVGESYSEPLDVDGGVYVEVTGTVRGALYGG